MGIDHCVFETDAKNLVERHVKVEKVRLVSRCCRLVGDLLMDSARLLACLTVGKYLRYMIVYRIYI